MPQGRKSAYLAGPVAGLSEPEVNDWRRRAAILLDAAGWDSVLPLIYENNGSVFPDLAVDLNCDPEAVFDHDLSSLARADAILVGYPTGPMKSVGTAFEVGYAYVLNKPIVIWVAPDHYPERLHPFVSLTADGVTESLEKAVRLVADTAVFDHVFTVPPRVEGVKFDDDKLPMGLLPREPLEQVAAILAHGAKKYGAHNWRKGIEVQRNINAALRHIFAANEGEDNDPDSGLPHLAHAICDLMFVVETLWSRPDLDDRYRQSKWLSSSNLRPVDMT